MIKEFQYTTRKEMEPRPGTRFATTYYKQSLREYTLLRQHIYGVAAEIMAICDSDASYQLWATTPMKSFKKSTKGQAYTPLEIVTDMVEQFTKQKDIPSGLLGRWNRLFADTPWDFRLVTGVPARPTRYGELFESGNNYAS